MSINLNEYQKVKADEKFSVLRHPNGSEYKIAHEGLSPEIASRIHKMPMFAGGGFLNSPTGKAIATVFDPSAALSAQSFQNLDPHLSGSNPFMSVSGSSLASDTGTAQKPGPVAAPVGSAYDPNSVAAATGVAQTAQAGLSNNAAQTNTGGNANLSGTYGQGQALAGQLGGATNGVNNQQTAATGLQNTTNQLQNVANGTGPNPAQAMLNQQTGTNVSNQAALMAGQRGASANPGLIARQSAQQGAATQQQAVGQGATMQAQQQLGALGQLTGANQALAGVGAGQVGQAQAQNSQNAGIAQNQAGNQLAANTASTQAGQAQQQIQANALGQYNQTQAGQQANINTVYGAQNVAAMQGQQGLSGGLMNGAGALLGGALAGGAEAGAARGGKVEMHAYGDTVGPPADAAAGAVGPPSGEVMQTVAAPSASPTVASNQPQSSFFNFLKNWTSTDDKGQTSGPVSSGPSGSGAQALNQGVTGLGKGLGTLLGSAARGGTVKGLVSEGELVIPPKDANNPSAAAKDVARAKATGGTIKAASAGQKATHKGNSYANDKIEKDLPVGGVVIPRSVMQSKDPVRGAAEFVRAVQAKKGGK